MVLSITFSLAMLLVQKDGLTAEEQWASVVAVHLSEPAILYKAPIEANLPEFIPPELPVFTPEPVRTQRLQFELDYAHGNAEPEMAPIENELRIVNADEKSSSEPSIRVTLAKFHKAERLAVPHANTPGTPFPTPCIGVCVTFSSQGDAAIQATTGKKMTDFQEIGASICASHIATVPAGYIIQVANAIGIQTIQQPIASAIVQQRVAVNWRSIITNSLKYGTITALGIMSSGVFGTVSKGTIFVTALSHEAADDLPKLLSPGAPNPDPFLSNVMNEAASYTLNPAPGSIACQPLTFAGAYNGPGTTFVTGQIQVMQ